MIQLSFSLLSMTTLPQRLGTCCPSAWTAPPLLSASLTCTHFITCLNVTTWSPDQGHPWSYYLKQSILITHIISYLNTVFMPPLSSTRMRVSEKEIFAFVVHSSILWHLLPFVITVYLSLGLLISIKGRSHNYLSSSLCLQILHTVWYTAIDYVCWINIS